MLQSRHSTTRATLPILFWPFLALL
jgi:hypothetical protein